MRRIYDLAKKTKWDLNICAIAKQLYDYAGITQNDTVRKKMLLEILDTCEKSELKHWYSTCKEELTGEEWEKEYEHILETVKRKDIKFYLDICMETGREDIVLQHLQSQYHGYDYWDVDYEQYFSKRLSAKYPDEVLALYWRDVNQLLVRSNNKNYGTAVQMLGKIKALMKKKHREEEWEKQFFALREVPVIWKKEKYSDRY